jgi:hypothetical protein
MTKPDPIFRGLLRAQVARETIASVSLSHRADCVCVICRAAKGDEDAFAELLPIILGEMAE